MRQVRANRFDAESRAVVIFQPLRVRNRNGHYGNCIVDDSYFMSGATYVEASKDWQMAKQPCVKETKGSSTLGHQVILLHV